VAARVDALIEAGLVVEGGAMASTGGRPATRLAFDASSGIVLVGDLGATHARIGVTDLAGDVLLEVAADNDIASGPVAVLDWLCDEFRHVLATLGQPAAAVRGVGIGVPGPVEHASGRPVSPPIMPGWDGFDVVGYLQRSFPVPVLVDNDVNIMALGEYWTHYRDDLDDLLFVKIGTGIGSGIVASGSIQRGAQGAAGDLGHVRVENHDEAVCRCGNVGCVEAVAGGQALADRLAAQGYGVTNARGVADLVAAGDRAATRLLREAGRTLGQVLAAAVNILNPGVIVVGGDIAEGHEQLLAGVREVVYERSLPLATRDLRLVSSQLGDGAGVRGAAVMVIEQILSPARVDALLADGPDDQPPAACPQVDLPVGAHAQAGAGR
jgi:predicted NBD/HSP70 family sugar kinase